MAFDNFAFMLKTHSPDRAFVLRLVESYHLHNNDKIQLFIVAPASDLGAFRGLECETVTLVAEEGIPTKLLKTVKKTRDTGYINQQVLKLAFHRMSMAENYLCLDSDAVFVRDFHFEDFLHKDGLPFQVLVEDKLLRVDADYFRSYWDGRSTKLGEIAVFLGIGSETNLKTCHGFQIIQSSVLRRFEDEVLSKRKLDYLDLIQEYGYEFTWYNYFLQKTEPLIHEIEPLFHVIHTGRQLVAAQLFKPTNNDYGRGYVGVVVNGNFQHFSRPASIDRGHLLSAAAYLPTLELMRIALRFATACVVRLFALPVVQIARPIADKLRWFAQKAKNKAELNQSEDD